MNTNQINDKHQGKFFDIGKLVSSMPECVYWKDTNGTYMGCNDFMLHLAGFKSQNEIIGKNDRDIGKMLGWADDVVDGIVTVDKEVLSSGVPKLNIEEPPLIMADGNVAFQRTSKVPLKDDKGNVVGLIGISIDITELKNSQEREKLAAIRIAQEKAQTEAEKELRQAVMILAGSIAHDLRTPISVINLEGHSLQRSLNYLLKMYRDSGDDKFSDSQLSDLEKAGDELRKIAMQMHDYVEVTLKTLSRGLKGGLTQEDLVECSMWHCIHNTLLRYPFSEEQKKLVEWDQADFKFMGNELLTVRIFSNLITNSLQQIEKNKTGKIFISTEKADSGNIIRFKDTAGGASPEIVNHLFDGYKTTKEKGTGIGLAFCKMTLDSFGGSINCHSVEGDYIEFVLNFPGISL
ncbi:MAG TPA: PAS domain-containing sensor histidine kinase [Gammaproteobacteria bacterium]|nr:PAS domain-containing sensor histidine kinase [Gammaproteobacteria bacterium]